MFESEFQANLSDKFKQIEDIIDSKKLLGLYNIPKHNSSLSFRSPGTSRCLGLEESLFANEGDFLNNFSVKHTDSEITVVRVKCQELPLKIHRSNKWDMHDIAVPGDGTHLAESPSLVNLVTLVGNNRPFEGEEYLVPLSSWEPYYKYEEKSTEMRCYSDSTVNRCNNRAENLGKELKNEKSDLICRRAKWAGRISKFLRKHCTKTKTLEVSTDDHN